MTDLLTQNSKIKHTGQLHGQRLFNFGIPAGFSSTGLKTCPMAGTCAIGCYAKAGAYIWGNVKPAYEHRLAITQQANFKELMNAELRRKRASVVRIHDSGDYYSLDYIMAWFAIMIENPTVKFYSYTKMVPLFLRLEQQSRIPANFTLIYSFGGLADKQIDITKHRHSAVFPDRATLDAAGYAYASEDDLVAVGSNPRIGLVYHGGKAKAWTAGGKAA